MKYRFHEAAAREIDSIADYYRGKSEDLGLKFYQQLELAIRKAREHPYRGRQMERPRLRKVELRKFPYRLLYSIKPDFILILSCAHTKMSERHWKNRLND